VLVLAAMSVPRSTAEIVSFDLPGVAAAHSLNQYLHASTDLSFDKVPKMAGPVTNLDGMGDR
jgi:hypothetical protein